MRFFRRRKKRASKKISPKDREAARAIVHTKLAYFNQYYNLSYKKVFIKNTKARWGSCSSKGNLNFNYQIIHLPDELANYLVVHELCHLQEFNHSKDFWNLVKQTIPYYSRARLELRKVRIK